MQEDPFLWLEAIEGERALAWVRAQNARTLAVLEGDPRYPALHDAALAIVTAQDRIPYPAFLGERLTNFWQDEQHVRGLWRHTDLAEYRRPGPQWETLLDLDALAAAEGRNWVFHGAVSLPPEHRRCLVALSDGGKDAAELREFDIAATDFVADGFRLPEGKQSAAWLDDNALLVARDWGPGTTTASGYPFILKRWVRGQALDAAAKVFRGAAEDVMVQASVLRDPDGRRVGIMIARAIGFFETEHHLLTDEGGRVRLDLPLQSSFRGFVAGRLVFTLQQQWQAPSGTGCGAGALIALDLAEAAAAPAALRPEIIETPGPREAIEDVAATRSCLLVAINRNVTGTAFAYRSGDGGTGWTRTRLPLPELAAVHVVAASRHADCAFVDVAGFLDPSTLWLIDPVRGAGEPVKAAPERFGRAGLTVEQFEAVSKDGTRVPYFVLRPQALAYDGSAPTVLYGYGGFQVSLTPSYAAIAGRLWLERGGVHVVANIRGGGEFGPAWHQAALKTERQRAYDDFIAVAEDLIARAITSPRRLGIMGGSNGGLLMGAMLTQRPELFRAAVIQVPLLDMLRFHKLLAGASWIGEYGDPEVPEEAAFLRRISPYHNLHAGMAYPEPLFVTSTKDDRVHPGHARKFAAQMETLGLPFLYYENIDGGHAAAANLRERARRHALEYTYLTRKLMD